MLKFSRANLAFRMQEVRNFLSFIKEQESDLTPPVDSDTVKILRGLYFVHLSAAFEKSINEAVEFLLQEIDKLDVPFNNLSAYIFPTALDSKFTALLGARKWTKRVELIDSMMSSEKCSIPNTTFGMMLQNAKAKKLLEVALYLGIRTPLLSSAKDMLYLDEVIEKRNQVAHGRTSPLIVGGSGRYLNLAESFDAVNRVLNEYLDLLEAHFNSLAFISPSNRAMHMHRIH